MSVGNIVGDQRNFHSERRVRLIRLDIAPWQIGCTKLMGRKGQRCLAGVQLAIARLVNKSPLQSKGFFKELDRREHVRNIDNGVTEFHGLVRGGDVRSTFVGIDASRNIEIRFERQRRPELVRPEM